MAKKDMIFIGVILLLAGVIAKMWMDSSKQKKRIEELEEGSGRALPGKQKPKALPSKENDKEEEELPPVKLKQPQKNLMSLFKDKTPKTNTELKELFKKSFTDMEKTKFNNMLWNLRKIGVLDIEKDQHDVNYWGPDEWFDDNGMIDEEYAKNVPSLMEKDEEEDKKEKGAKE